MSRYKQLFDMFCLKNLRNQQGNYKPGQLTFRSIILSLKISLFILILTAPGCKQKPEKETSSKAKIAEIIDINMSLINIYGMLNGDGDADERTWITPVNNWVYSDITSDNAYKGSTINDHPEALKIETYDWQPNNKYFNIRWISLYKSIDKCNKTLRMIKKSQQLDQETSYKLEAEARFLRGHFHFEAKNLWNNVPWINENSDMGSTGNQKDIWPLIEADFRFAVIHLPDSQLAPGRVTSWAAKAYLAKSLMFQKNLEAARPVLDDIIQNGPFSLENCYFDNFSKASMKHNESVFNAEYVIDEENTQASVRSLEETTETLEGGPKEYCEYHQPSQNLVNAFKTGPDGLPIPHVFNDTDIKNDEDIPSTKHFIPYKGTLDPRIDFTVGRRGLPFLDYGIHPGMDWITDQSFAGPYSMKKYILSHADKNSATMSSSWAEGATSKTYRVIRFAHILLWRAEIAAEENDLDLALALVNKIRERAKSGCVLLDKNGQPAANYLIGLYDNFPDKESAMEAIRFETRLELGMEGNRFFNLRRWGLLEKVIQGYLRKEKTKRLYLKNAHFIPGKHQYFPIPATQLAQNPNLKQNPGY